LIGGHLATDLINSPYLAALVSYTIWPVTHRNLLQRNGVQHIINLRRSILLPWLVCDMRINIRVMRGYK